MLKDAIASANLASLIDGAFDSMNGSSDNKNNEKPMLNIVTRESGHVEFWSETCKAVSKLHFVNENGKKNLILQV